MMMDKFMALIGHSLFAEEYRGDLETAANEALRWMQDGPEDLDEYATILSGCIILFTLVGKFHDAYGLLDRLKEDVLGHLPHWGLRYTTYKLWMDYTRLYPPCLRFQHQAILPPNLSPLSDIPCLPDITREQIENTKLHIGNAISEDTYSCRLFQCLSSYPQMRYYTVTTLHPLYPDGDWKRSDRPTLESLLAENFPSLLEVKSKATAVDDDRTVRYLERLEVELHYSMDSSSAKPALESLCSAYERVGDLAGMANCKLMEGDSYLSPPFSSPLTFNLIPVDSDDVTGKNNLWNPVEARVTPLKDSTDAAECYDLAWRLFKDANCPRGQAAVLLRQGCCLHTRASDMRTRNGDWKAIIEDASKKLEEAATLFGADEANVQIVKAHQLLLAITRGNHTEEVKSRASEIGKWGSEARNELVPHFIGRLLLRFANREWTRYSRFDAAIFAYECAYQCAEQIEDIIPAFQSLASRVYIHNDMFNPVDAGLLMGQCIGRLGAVLSYYDSKIALCQPETDLGNSSRMSLLSGRFRLLSSIDSLAITTYSRSGELEALEKWQDKYMEYIDREESFQWLHLANGDISEQTSHSLIPGGRTIKDVIATAMNEQRVVMMFNAIDIQFQRALSDGDLQKGEHMFYQFIGDAPRYDARLTGVLMRVIACQRIGDVKKAREILDSVSDEFLFNERLGNLSGDIAHTSFHLLASNAISACLIAADWTRGWRVLDIIRRHSPSFFDFNVFGTNTALDQASNLAGAGLITLHNHQSELAFQQLLGARLLVETCRRETTDVDARIGTLSSSKSFEIYMSLAHICLRCAAARLPLAILSNYDHGHPSGTSWEEHALLFLEEARARAVLDSLQVSTPEADSIVFESIYKRRVMTHLQSLSERDVGQEEELLRVRAELDRVDRNGWSNSERALFEAVGTNTCAKDLFEHIKEEEVVIEAIFSRYQGNIIFCITSKGIEHHHVGDIRDTDMRRLVVESMQVLRSMTGLQGTTERDRKDHLNNSLSQISEILLTPFASIISSKKYITFSVSQPLTAFPLSALPFDKQPLFLHAAVSQTPSLTVLSHLSRRQPASASASTEPMVTVFTRGYKSASNELQSQTSDSYNEKYLPMAGIEALNIAHMFSTWPIDVSDMSRSRFRDYLKCPSSVLHIGVHGNVNHQKPLLSSISIGEEFRVLDMSHIQSQARLMVFAACLSGLGKATVGNDVLGFTHVVLGTGCQAYIGTLWEVSDLGTMLLMTLFYRNLRQGSMLVTEALRQAQATIFQMTSVDAERLLDEVIETWDLLVRHRKEEGLPCATDLVIEGRYLLELEKKRYMTGRDWSSPFYWAPFVLMGYGGFQLMN